jgi:hypothetical protein
VHGISEVRQAEIHPAESLVPEPSAFEVKMAIEKLKRYKSPVTNQIPAELIKAGGRTIRAEVHKLINSVWNKKELPEQWKESIIVSIIRMVIKQIVALRHLEQIEAYHFCQPHIKFYQTSFCKGLNPCAEEIIGDHQCGF